MTITMIDPSTWPGDVALFVIALLICAAITVAILCVLYFLATFFSPVRFRKRVLRRGRH